MPSSPQLIYSHRWQVGDVVIWDNRSVLHRATAYDRVNRRRLMQRTTVSNPAVLETPAYRQIETRRSSIAAS
jgi:alpha-ketoglutarate-dependent taurine dioxygenase